MVLAVVVLCCILKNQAISDEVTNLDMPAWHAKGVRFVFETAVIRVQYWFVIVSSLVLSLLILILLHCLFFLRVCVCVLRF